MSILIPAYNAERWVADTIKSALAQTWPRKEIVIVDDGSEDRTLAVARKFAARDVSVATQENQGAAAARNKAFSLAQGDYIQWLDADDLLARDKVSRQLEILNSCQSKRTLCSGSWGAFYYRTRSARFRPSPLWADLSPVEWLLRKMGQNCHMQTATWLVSRELTEAAGPWDTRLLGDDDGEYFCRVLKASDRVKFVPEAKVYYRHVGSNRLSYVGRSDKKMDAQFVSMQLHIQYLRSLEDSERSRAACVRYLQKYMLDFCPERPDIVKQMEQLASGLGGRLEAPRASWKYYWIQKIFGWGTAKRALFLLPDMKSALIRRLDKVMYAIERPDCGSSDSSRNL
ncbi:MAG TPA: glycosyltransferase family 2 protein [Candidatus Sulfopaludibacter sp.]|nr:glycosyltransferase family 2 protein [Candidatus Sulfopaludibacter sp.]